MAAAQTTTARSQSDARGDGFRTVSPPAESVPHRGLGRDVQPRQRHPVGAPGRGRADLGGGRPKASLPRAVPPVNGSWTDTGQQRHQDQHEDHGHDRDLREEQAPQPGTAQLRRGRRRWRRREQGVRSPTPVPFREPTGQLCDPAVRQPSIVAEPGNRRCRGNLTDAARSRDCERHRGGDNVAPRYQEGVSTSWCPSTSCTHSTGRRTLRARQPNGRPPSIGAAPAPARIGGCPAPTLPNCLHWLRASTS
jgi:hypothetical protein